MNIKGISTGYTEETKLVQNNQTLTVPALESGQEDWQNNWNGPQGIVSISKEGKQLLEESQAAETEIQAKEPVQSQSAKTEKSPVDNLYDQIDQVEKRLAEISGNKTEGKRTEETDKDYDEALEALRKLREEEARQYEEEAEEAKKRAMENSKHMGVVEKGNRDLVIMLESFKGLNKDKDAKSASQRKHSDSAEESGRAEDLREISGQIRSDAAASDGEMDKVINNIHEKAQEGFRKAGEIRKDMRKQIDGLREFVSDASNSMQEKEEAVAQFVKDSGHYLNEIEDYQGQALQRMKIFKDVSLKRLEDQHMIKAERAQEIISGLADDAAVQDAFYAAYESQEQDKIEELEERIKELQGIDSTPAVEEKKNLFAPMEEQEESDKEVSGKEMDDNAVKQKENIKTEENAR